MVKFFWVCGVLLALHSPALREPEWEQLLPSSAARPASRSELIGPRTPDTGPSDEEMLQMYRETAEAIEDLPDGNVDSAYLGRAKHAVLTSGRSLMDNEVTRDRLAESPQSPLNENLANPRRDHNSSLR